MFNDLPESLLNAVYFWNIQIYVKHEIEHLKYEYYRLLT